MLTRTDKNTSGLWTLVLVAALLGATALLMVPVSAKGVVTVVVQGDQKYYQGEEVTLRGTNTDSDTTYLFMTGPERFMSGPGVPANGGKLTAPTSKVSGGDAGSFVRVKTNPDKSWEYTWFTNTIGVDAGSYTIYAVSQPVSKDQFKDLTTYGSTPIILMQPFIMGEVSPSPVIKGQPFTVTGTAEGEPPTVQVLLIGDNTFSVNPKVTVNPGAAYSYTVDAATSGQLSQGQAYVIVQHSMQNNELALVVSGDSVRNVTTGKTLFKISGAGSLKGPDAEKAYVAALSDPTIDDTYTVIPIQVSEAPAGSSAAEIPPALGTAPLAVQQAAAPVQTQTHPAPLLLAPFGALLVIVGIVAAKRRQG
jgi:hypothetical protein